MKALLTVVIVLTLAGCAMRPSLYVASDDDGQIGGGATLTLEVAR